MAVPRSRGKAPVVRSVGQVPQKLVILCKLNYATMM